MKKVRDIIERCGGPDRIAKKSGGAIRAVSIQNWVSPTVKWGTRGGIPSKHWATLMRLDKTLTVDELHEANEEARRSKKRPERVVAA
jgi:hypothetical protein